MITFRQCSSVDVSSPIILISRVFVFAGGLAPLGAFVGCIIATIPIQYFGPKGTVLFFSGPVFFISWILMAFAPSLQWIYVSRFIGTDFPSTDVLRFCLMNCIHLLL